MKIVLDCYHDSKLDEWDFDACAYLVLNLTPELVSRIEKQIELARAAAAQDDSLRGLQFLAGGLKVYRHETLGKALKAAMGADFDNFESQGGAPLPDGFDLSPFWKAKIKQQWFRVWPALKANAGYFEWLISPFRNDPPDVLTQTIFLESFQKALSLKGVAA